MSFSLLSSHPHVRETPPRIRGAGIGVSVVRSVSEQAVAPARTQVRVQRARVTLTGHLHDIWL